MQTRGLAAGGFCGRCVGDQSRANFLLPVAPRSFIWNICARRANATGAPDFLLSAPACLRARSVEPAFDRGRGLYELAAGRAADPPVGAAHLDSFTDAGYLSPH